MQAYEVWKRTLKDWSVFASIVAGGCKDPIEKEGPNNYQRRVFGKVRFNFRENSDGNGPEGNSGICSKARAETVEAEGAV